LNSNSSYKLIYKTLLTINNKLNFGGIFCDLGKSFDCVSHNILLSKLEFCGIIGIDKILPKKRCQRVLIYDRNTHENTHNNTSSRWQKVKHGVP
jgi:hypothetical protein